jgi:hypothetical protein
MYLTPIIIIIIIILIILSSNISSQSSFLFHILPTQQQKHHNVAIASMMRKPTDLPLWLKHHRSIGVKLFFIRLEDSPGWEDYLQTQPDIIYETGQSDPSGNNYLTQQYRQIEFVNKSLEICKNKNIQWLFHIDADELLNGTFDFLHTLPPSIKCLHYENAEALFDENQQHCFSSKTFLRCSLNAPCRSYANGKAAGKTENFVTLAGCHNFAYHNQIDGDHVYNVPFDTLHVLHFDSCSLGTWIEKFHHMSKKNNSDIPFTYYHNSIDLAIKSYNTYKSNTHINKSIDLDPKVVYKLDTNPSIL